MDCLTCARTSGLNVDCPSVEEIPLGFPGISGTEDVVLVLTVDFFRANLRFGLCTSFDLDLFSCGGPSVPSVIIPGLDEIGFKSVNNSGTLDVTLISTEDFFRAPNRLVFCTPVALDCLI